MRNYSTPRAAELAEMTSADIRKHFLLEGLFTPGKIELARTDLDRLLVGGIMPQPELRLPGPPETAGNFLEGREAGIINVGEVGKVQIGAATYTLDHLDCLYIGTGETDVFFRNRGQGQAAFYLLSAPAHRKLPTRKATVADASVHELGDPRNASRRRLVQYIHEGGIESCQLVMGFTTMHEGSVWNTWPPHTHLRRSEIYSTSIWA